MFLFSVGRNSSILAVAIHLVAEYCHALAGERPFLRRIRSTVAPFSLPWYENGLKFDCTGCGKCCKVDGDVWLAPEEVDNIMTHLGYCDRGESSIDDFRMKYVKAEVSPSDGDNCQSWLCLKRKEGACIFLDPLGKCGIYDARPIQCSTYPFWPSILENQEAWKEESVLPDSVDVREGTNDRHWSPDLGGCEGIIIEKAIESEIGLDNGNPIHRDDLVDLLDEGVESSIVARQEIISKMRAAKKHWKRFPVKEIKESTWYL
mmetsp:Transcript_34496/g.83482  ORF Transcript_34496/g.83482 Transcript_34496/m.83482 type:complete len:261 (-) Transcript_34496:99-881(-)